MCMASSPPPAPKPPPEPPKESSRAVRQARMDSRNRARGMLGDSSTQTTGARGLMAPAKTGQTTLLGG